MNSYNQNQNIRRTGATGSRSSLAGSDTRISSQRSVQGTPRPQSGTAQRPQSASGQRPSGVSQRPQSSAGYRSGASAQYGTSGARAHTGQTQTSNRPPISQPPRRPTGQAPQRGTNIRNTRKRTKRKSDGAVSSAMNSIIKAIIYIVAVAVVSGALSVFGIEVCNDMLAFIKDDKTVTVTVPEGATIGEIGEILHDAGAVKFPWFFKIYAEKRYKSGADFEPGEHSISTNLSYDNLLSALVHRDPERTTISVTIPEGYSVDNIISLFVDELGMGTREGFIDAIENYEWDYWFVKELDEAELDESRKYRLEGYLFPDTYYYFSDASEVAIIYKMLENFEEKFTETMKERANELGYTVDEILALASIIQSEAKFPSEYPDISSVLHNRLNNPYYETQGRLQSDPTVMYVLEGHRTNLTAEEKELDNPYNTYVYKGLPPSAICNPSLYAINCALYPNSSDNYYFLAIGSGYHVFAKTYDEHIQNILEYSN